MNHIIVIGQLKDAAFLKDGKLIGTVIVKRKGSGTHKDKTFSTYFGVESFGRDQTGADLGADTWVEASGEASAQPYQSKKDQKWYARVMIKGFNCLKPLGIEPEQPDLQPVPTDDAPVDPPPEPTPKKPETDETDVPF